MEFILTLLAIIVGIILAIGLVAFVLFKYFSSKAKQAIGMDLTETAQLLKKGFEAEANIPKSISNMTAVYKPKLTRDFPDVSYEQIEAIATNGIVSIFNAIEEKDVERLQYQSASLIQQVKNQLDDNYGRGISEYFDSVKVHKAGICEYQRTDNAARVIFEVSLEYIHYTKKDGKISGSNTQLTQAVYRVVICYDYDSGADDNGSVVYSHNCPNCGAPVTAMGSNKICRYCGSGLTEISDRIWLINSYKLTK